MGCQACTRALPSRVPPMRVLPIVLLSPSLAALDMLARPCRPQKKERRSDTTVWLEDTLLLAPSLDQDGTVPMPAHIMMTTFAAL